MVCSAWSNKLITAKDHASVQINIGHLDGNGVYSGAFTTYALAGKVRGMVSAWSSVDRQHWEVQVLPGQLVRRSRLHV